MSKIKKKAVRVMRNYKEKLKIRIVSFKRKKSRKKKLKSKSKKSFLKILRTLYPILKTYCLKKNKVKEAIKKL